MRTKEQCESCLMPFNKDPNPSARESEKYCSLCYKDGAFCYEGDVKGFQKICYEGMRARGMNPIAARIFSWMVRFAPRWRGR